MSAKRAAQALIELDTELAAFSADLAGWRSGKRQAVVEFIRANVMNTWTLTLAARSAGVTEVQVVAALLNLPPLKTGSTHICRSDAEELFAI